MGTNLVLLTFGTPYVQYWTMVSMFQTLNYDLLLVVAVVVYFETLFNKSKSAYTQIASLTALTRAPKGRWPDLQATAFAADSLYFVLHGIASYCAVAAFHCVVVFHVAWNYVVPCCCGVVAFRCFALLFVVLRFWVVRCVLSVALCESARFVWVLCVCVCVFRSAATLISWFLAHLYYYYYY